MSTHVATASSHRSYSFLGHLKGGLAYATIMASAGFAAISGSSIATAATEAASIGAGGSLLFAISRKKLSFRTYVESLLEASKMTGMIFTILFGGKLFANFIVLSGLTNTMVSWIQAQHFTGLEVILVIVLIYVLLGSVMEGLSMMMLTVPIFAAIVEPLGINMIWFGVFVVLMMEIGLIHPPMGMNIFMVKTIMPELQLRTIFVGSLPFLATAVVTLMILILFPGLALLLVPKLG
jgi:TRAP-type C4-dicarboxylate transport system permease large subunit